jgi:hypothetical protein
VSDRVSGERPQTGAETGGETFEGITDADIERDRASWIRPEERDAPETTEWSRAGDAGPGPRSVPEVPEEAELEGQPADAQRPPHGQKRRAGQWSS